MFFRAPSIGTGRGKPHGIACGGGTFPPKTTTKTCVPGFFELSVKSAAPAIFRCWMKSSPRRYESRFSEAERHLSQYSYAIFVPGSSKGLPLVAGTGSCLADLEEMGKETHSGADGGATLSGNVSQCALLQARYYQSR